MRGIIVVVFACGVAACTTQGPRPSILKVSYYAQDSAFISAEPLRVSVGAGTERHDLRGAELAPYHPFLVSGAMPLDSGATLPVTVVMLGANADTAALAQLTLGPVEVGTEYSLGISAGGRQTTVRTPSRCGSRIAVALQRADGIRAGDSLYVSISGMREGVAC